MKLAVSTKPFAGLSVPETVSKLTDVGIKAVELWPLAFNNQYIFDKKETDNNINEFLKKGISIASMSYGAAFLPELSHDSKSYIKNLCNTIEIASDAGVKVVNHYCKNIINAQNSKSFNFSVFFDEAINLAEKKNVVLSFENEAFDVNGNPMEMLSIIEQINSKNFQTNFDPANYYQNAVEPVPYAFDILKSHIGYVHLKDCCVYSENNEPALFHIGKKMKTASGEKDICYTVLGEGAVPISLFLSKLSRISYSGYCTIEINTSPEKCLQFFRKDIEVLKQTDLFCNL